MIHLFAGGKSSVDNFDKVDGMKVVINFGFEVFKDFDMLIFLDEIVGYTLQKKYDKRPPFYIVCAKINGRMIKDWLYEEIDTWGAFTISNAIIYLRSKFPDDDIIVYGLDGGNARDYYDDIIEKDYGIKQPEEIERVRRLNRCYDELSKLPCGTDRIYNGNPNSPCKAFEFYKEA